MRSFWVDVLALFKRHPNFAAILGFFSIGLVWLIPSYTPFIAWGEWFSWAYIYGDHLVLPLFNAQAFWLFAKNEAGISKKALFAPFLMAIALTIAFEPDASAFLKDRAVDSIPEAYHSAFIALELGFVFFMCAVYPHLRGVYAPLWAITILTGLMVVFLGFVQIADAWMHPFSLLVDISPATLLMGNYGILVLQRKFDIFGKLKRVVSKEDQSEETTTV